MNTRFECLAPKPLADFNGAAADERYFPDGAARLSHCQAANAGWTMS
jgi:hypothetical protein